MALSFYHTGGGASNSVLGGQISTLALAETKGLLLPSVSLTDAAAGITHYACICIKNTGASSIANAGIYMSSVVSAANVYIARGLTGKNSTTEQTIANNTTAPTGSLVFERPLFDYSPVSFGLLDVGEFYHCWIKRTYAANSAGSTEDYIIFTGVES